MSTPLSVASRLLALIPALLLCINTALAAPTGFLNDTGQTTCDNGANVMVACTNATAGIAAPMPGQDGRYGRDVAALVKVGGGAAGFDFTRVCFNGDLQGAGSCTGGLVANTTGTATGSPGTDWACTKDNVTNLIWSLQSAAGTWAAMPVAIAATQAATRCGFATGWRLPTRRELMSFVHNGLATQPSVDLAYFPGTQVNFYWSSDPYQPIPSLIYVWIVDFGTGYGMAHFKTVSYVGRLVRSGP